MSECTAGEAVTSPMSDLSQFPAADGVEYPEEEQAAQTPPVSGSDVEGKEGEASTNSHQDLSVGVDGERGESGDDLATPSEASSMATSMTLSSTHAAFDADITPEELEEKARLIQQVLELQNTLDDLSQRVDAVKEENLKLKSENQVLGQYIENLMSASSVFQSTSPTVKKRSGKKK